MKLSDKKVGIIGCKGKFGQWLTRFFTDRACTVIGSDPSIEGSLSNQYIVLNSDVVIFAVPLDQMTSVIESVVPYGCPKQVWITIASTQSEAFALMQKSTAYVVAIHPLFAPDDRKDWSGQTVSLDAYGDVGRDAWTVAFLEETKATIEYTSVAEHDSVMLYTQVLPQVILFAFLALLLSAKIRIHRIIPLSTRLSRPLMWMLGRVLTQRAQLYASIWLSHTTTVEVLNRFIAELMILRRLIETRDLDQLNRKIRMAQEGMKNADSTFVDTSAALEGKGIE